MAYWAIAIGINQYRFLPPLSYAQRDAELLHEFLRQQAGFATNCCALIHDQVTIVSSDPRFPTAENIQTWLASYQQRVKPGDVVLCFFSGYGVTVEGKDYLLPIEADPKQVAATGIAIESVLAALRAMSTSKIVLMLDANRSQLGLERSGFGNQTIQLAEKYGIAALLSCQPNQFSHEPLTLRQGIFTAALIAALQSGCMTLEQLVNALAIQMPQLSEEFWRPRQDLLAVVPPHLRYQLIVPEFAGKFLARTPALSGASHLKSDRMNWSQQFSFLKEAGIELKQKVTRWFAPAAQSEAVSTLPAEVNHSSAVMALPGSESSPEDLGLTDEFFWRRLVAQGGLIAVILLFGVILRNSGALISSASRTNSIRGDRTATTPASATDPAAIPSAANPIATVAPLPIDPVVLMQSAQVAFQAQQYEDANRQLAQIPAAQRTPEQLQLLEQTNRELLNKAKTMLIRTREPRAENQVSDLVEAIKIARLLTSDQPLYQEAQQNIDRWSRVILDMAQGRSTRSNAASVMDAASNYSLAISAARLVPNDQAVYQQAQQAIDLWSQKILELANTRAANGELDLAIQIGESIPPNTPAYAPAQEAIASWRNQPAPTEQSAQPPVEEAVETTAETLE